MASMAVIARISQMATVTVFPQINNLQFFVKFSENVYHREKPKCICFKKKANKASVIQLKKVESLFD